MSKKSKESGNNNYFNSIFKTHLYYKRSFKDANNNDKVKSNNSNEDDQSEQDDGLSDFIYTSQNPPKSSGSSIIETNKSVITKSNLKYGRGLGTKNDTENVMCEIRLDSTPKFSKKGTRVNYNSPFTIVTPKFYENGESTLIRRGKFKGSYDDRQLRCLYFQGKMLKNPNNTQQGCFNCPLKRCYCSHIPIIKSPLEKMKCFHDAEGPVGDGRSSLTSKKEFIMNRFSFDEKRDNQLSSSHLISRVKQKLNNEQVIDNNNTTKETVRKIHSLNNFKKIPHSRPSPEPDLTHNNQPEQILNCSIRNIAAES